MKNITKSIIALFAVLAISCNADDVEDRPVVLPVDAPVLLAPEENNSYVLAPEDATQQAERFVWSEANFDENVAVTYVVQIDKAGNEFANPQDLGSIIGSTLLSVTVETLNDKVIATGANAFELAQFEVRVKASLNDTFEPMYSNAVTISVTPYTTETPKLWLPGSYQGDSGYGSNWTQSTAATLASEGFGNTNFEGYIYFANTVVADSDNGFKFSSQANWDGTNYGDDGTFSGTLSPTGENIGANAGYYRVTANTDPTILSYNLTPTQWGIAGNATTNGWDGMTPMTYNPTTKKWSIIAVLTTQVAPDNGLKFKANGAWDINLGDNGADGSAEYGGTNIGTTAGTYLIELDLSNPRQYTYTLTPQ